MNIDFKLSVMILNFRNATVFCCLNLPALVIGCAFSWLLCPFDILPPMIFFLRLSVVFGTTRLFSLILYILTQSLNQPFFQEAVVPFIGEYN